MDKIKLPNFLIVGMAKCGTSSLSQYLQQHPEVFVSKKKEPRFLSSQVLRFPMNGVKDDLVEKWYVKNFDEYQELFKDATEKAIGEASADTLYFYKDTISVIQKYLGDPKIIIILRDPVERAFSAYQHLVRDKREFLSFEDALSQESERVFGNYELIYHYKRASLYYESVKAFYKAFSNVKVILNEELRNNPNNTLNEVFEFLDVGPYKVDTSLKYNVSGVPKNQLLQEALQDDNIIRKVVRPITRTILPSGRTRATVFNWITRKNLRRLEMVPAVREILKNDFKEDIKKTSDLINKDLSRWVK